MSKAGIWIQWNGLEWNGGTEWWNGIVLLVISIGGHFFIKTTF